MYVKMPYVELFCSPPFFYVEKLENIALIVGNLFSKEESVCTLNSRPMRCIIMLILSHVKLRIRCFDGCAQAPYCHLICAPSTPPKISHFFCNPRDPLREDQSIRFSNHWQTLLVHLIFLLVHGQDLHFVNIDQYAWVAI